MIKTTWTSRRSEVESIRTEMRFLATQVRGLPIRQANKLRRRREVTNNCPNCGKIVQYKQTLKPTSIKALPCDNCGSRLYSRVTNDRFVLDLRTPIVEKVHCPGCDQEIVVKLDPVPGSVQEFQCITCQMDLSAIRQPKGVRVKFGGQTKGPPPAPTITDKLLKSIADAMGQQPWPTGKARAVAKQLNISSTTVHRAIKELIRRDVFKLQSGGKLYVPTPDD